MEEGRLADPRCPAHPGHGRAGEFGGSRNSHRSASFAARIRRCRPTNGTGRRRRARDTTAGTGRSRPAAQ